MGEISEALRRAREGLRRDDARPAATLVEPAPRHLAPRRLGAQLVIPSEASAGWSARSVLVQPDSESSERYRQFAVRLQREIRKRNARIVLVTSPARGEGKTTTSCNLALAFASMASGRRIALVEADVRRPAVAAALGVSVAIGFEQVLEGDLPLEEACAHTQFPELDLFLAARPARRPLAAVSSVSSGQVLRALAAQYDLVIIDSPPVLPVPDVPLLLPHVDTVLLVARNGVSRRAALRDSIGSLTPDKVVGVFLNEGRTPMHRRYEGYYGYGTEREQPAVETKDGD